MPGGNYRGGLSERLSRRRPELYRSLQEGGQLDEWLSRRAREASEQSLLLTKELERRSPPPKDAPYHERVAHLNALRLQAEESVLAEMLGEGAPDELPEMPPEQPEGATTA